MKRKYTALVFCIVLLSCNAANNKHNATPTIVGTWQLFKSIVIAKGDTTVTDYTKNVSFIKIINDTHFAFLQHDLNKGKEPAVFVAGGGTYTLSDSVYTEHLQYCSARDWEGNDFTFNITLKGDTLIQRGLEKVEGTGIDQINIEEYSKVQKR